MAELSDYLTVQDVADRLGVSVFTIRRYIRAGKLRAVRLDAAYRISREDIREFLKSREIPSAIRAGHESGPSSAGAPTRASGRPSESASNEGGKSCHGSS